MTYFVEVEKKEGMDNEVKLSFSDLSEAIDLIQELAKVGFMVKIYGCKEDKQ